MVTQILTYIKCLLFIIFILQKQRSIMTARSQCIASGPQFLQLLRQFYCGLTVRKDKQNIACEIREFVMMRTDIISKDQTAKRLLDYFLKLQSKLVTKTNSQWDNAFEMSTARGEALLRICNFPNRHSCLLAFHKIKALQKLATADLTSILSSVQVRPSQYDDIQVQQDVRLKTYYFFKWCQYLQHAKMFKQLKMRQVENQKLSLTFNKYGTKFNYFSAWKKLYKKHKVQREKVKIIQNNYNQRILKNCLNAIQQTAAILAFQMQLAARIKQKIINCRKKLVYKKLGFNSQRVKKQIKCAKILSQCGYAFLKHFTSKLKPLMNKSFVTGRLNQTKLIEQQTILKSFLGIKKMTKATQQKIRVIKNHRRQQFIKAWRSQYHQNMAFNDKNSKFASYLTCRRSRIALIILHFNKMTNVDTSNAIMTNQMTSFAATNYVFINNKKTLDDKIKKLQKVLANYHEQLVFNKFRSIQEFIRQKKINITHLKNVCLMRFKNKLAYRKVQKTNKISFYQALAEKRQALYCKIAFKRWRKLKFYHRYEDDMLNIIDKCARKVTLNFFWNKFKCRVQEKQCLQKLKQTINFAFLKISFQKISKSSKIINKNVEVMKSQRNKRIMSNLFQLIAKNMAFNSQTAEGVYKCIAVRYKKTLLKNLKQFHQFKNQQKKVVAKLQANKIKLFLQKLQNFNKQNKAVYLKIERLTKKVFLNQYRKSVSQQTQINEKLQRKSDKLEERLDQLNKFKFFNRVKTAKNQQNLITSKQLKIKNKLILRNVIKLKQHIKIIQYHITLKRKQNKIIQNRISDALKLFSLKHKTRVLAQTFERNTFQSGFKDFNKLCISKRNIQSSTQQLCLKLYNKNVSQFYKFLQADKNQIDAKIQKVSQINQNKIRQNSKLMFSLLKSNKQNIQNEQKLVDFRKQTELQVFIAMSLKTKFERIKFNCSLKSYAKNLLTKAFRSLKHTHTKTKQKQNIARLDRTSSIMVQKSIEKSFKSNTLSQQIQRFNLRKSRQIR